MVLIPTIREEDSELWVTWNPRSKNSATNRRFREQTDPLYNIVEMNYRDNEMFPDKLERERQRDLTNNPEMYDHIWEGGFLKAMAGAYWAKDLKRAKEDGRISVVAEDPLMAKRLFFDIGGTGAKADAVSIWVAQFVGKQILVLDYYEAVGQPLATHLAWLREKGYDKASIWLPHDGATNDKVFDVSYQSALKGAGYAVTVVPNQGKGAAKARIESVRKTFPSVWFNKDTTEAGRDALGWYHERKDENRDIGLGPDHDWSSHAADAYGLMSIVYEKVGKQVKPMRDPYKAFRKTG
jgi:phage terminase large subunit